MKKGKGQWQKETGVYIYRGDCSKECAKKNGVGVSLPDKIVTNMKKQKNESMLLDWN